MEQIFVEDIDLDRYNNNDAHTSCGRSRSDFHEWLLFVGTSRYTSCGVSCNNFPSENFQPKHYL